MAICSLNNIPTKPLQLCDTLTASGDWTLPLSLGRNKSHLGLKASKLINKSYNASSTMGWMVNRADIALETFQISALFLDFDRDKYCQ